MIAMREWMYYVSLLGAAVFGAAAVVGMLYFCVQDDRRGRAKARRMRDHRVRA